MSSVARLLFVLLVLVFPLPRHWVLLDLGFDPVHVEFASLIWYLSDTVVVLFLITVAVWAWQQRPFERDFIPVIAIPLALLAVLALFSAIWAVVPPLATYTAVRLVALWLLYMAVVALRPAPEVVQVSLAASLVLQAGVAVLQFVYQHDLGLHVLGELELAPTRNFTSVISAGGHNWLRAYGLTPHPNILGGILAAFTLALIPAYLPRRKIAWLAVFLISGSGLILTFSRSAWLGLTIGASVFLLGVWHNRKWRAAYGRILLLPVAAALLLLLVFVLVERDLFMSRLLPSGSYVESRSLNERVALTRASLYLLGQYPLLLGMGAGNFSVVVERLDQGVITGIVNQGDLTSQPVHNVPLLITNELGLAGGVLWLWITLVPPVIAWRRLRSGQLTLWAWGLTAALLVLAVTDLVDFYSWGWAQGRLLRWLCLALWASAIRGMRSPLW
ncbi:MAG TPA: O-antigen ligase family protein [Anaerolineae bacterium]